MYNSYKNNFITPIELDQINNPEINTSFNGQVPKVDAQLIPIKPKYTLAFPKLDQKQKANPTFGATFNASDDRKWARQQNQLQIEKNISMLNRNKTR